MKRFSDLHEDELAVALRAIRPEPSPAFAAELDERAAAGFPRRSPEGSAAPGPLARFLDRLRAASPRRMLIPAGGLAIAAIAVATVVVSNQPNGSSTDGGSFDGPFSEKAAPDSGGGAAAEGGDEALTQPVPPAAMRAETESESSAGAAAPDVIEDGEVIEESPLRPDRGGNAAGADDRSVERAAEITIGTRPGEVGEASSQVFGIVHQYNGIVLNSSTTNGSGTDADANFELLIPSGRLGDAMAAFSKIGEVTSRRESTLDITAPTVGTSERLQDSNARIDSLLGQLADADDEGEREIVESELSYERAHAARLKADLADLKRRANLSRVDLRIESGRGALSPKGKDDSGWGVGNALDDSGHLLATAAGVSIIALAVLAPLALILFLVWLAGRGFTRRARERALT